MVQRQQFPVSVRQPEKAGCRRARAPNLRSVFGLQAIPSDTQLRTILDDVAAEQLRPAFQDSCRQLQRGKIVEEYVLLQGCYLVARDGLESFRREHSPR